MSIENNSNNLNPSTVIQIPAPNSAPSPTGGRRLSIIPNYLRRKSARKDSVFASESTTTLYPFPVEDKLPHIFNYKNSISPTVEGRLQFGWINGVYVRTVLNIWGVMLFLRMGWMTGHAGIVIALCIVLVSTLVTLFTTLSMSAICTNGEVGTGGIYYMISRSLGAEAGSMIGIIFSFANAVLVSLNLVGAAETAVEILGMHDLLMTDALNDTRIIGAILLIVVAIIPLIGMEWEAKAMFFLLLLLLASLINYVIGTMIPPSHDQIAEGFVGWKSWVIKENLWYKWDGVSLPEVFGVFFPSVIGIFAGASMSGDLRDPNAAIPKGTFLAITTTSSVYALLIVFLGCTVAPYASGNFEQMQNSPPNITCHNSINETCRYGLIPDYQTMVLSSGFGPLIYAGTFAATISSALGSYVCAPRIFQALCEDNLFPYIKFFAKGYGEINDPRRGYVLTFIIALAFILIGDLNAIAPIISNFFMASFFLVNIACFHASFVGSPSFRPTFKYYNQWVSLLTGLACVIIMFVLDYISATITVVIMGVILLYISKKGPDVNWGSSKRAQVYNTALSSTLKLNGVGDHIKNFRPSILLLTGNPSARVPLVEFANNITKNKSLLLIGHIINSPILYRVREKVIDSQYEWMTKRKIKAFYLLLESESLSSGAKCMLQVTGLGKLRANILMLGYKSSWQDCLRQDLVDYFNVILTGLDMKMSICILRVQEGLDYADFFESRPNSVEQQRRGLPTISEQRPSTEESIENGIVSTNRANNNIVHFSPNLTRTATKEQIESIKGLIPNDAIEAINQFNQKQKKGTIDIWWLTDDGGLTIMIPYILSLNDIWGDCTLQIFSITKTQEQIRESEEDLTQLLEKLRVPCSKVTVFAESELEPTDRSKEKFKKFVSRFTHREGSPLDEQMLVTEAALSSLRDRTNKYLKTRDLLVRNSSNATLIVMTLPLPSREIPLPIHMSWLEVLTEEMPPFLFVRGNKTVLSI